MTSTAMAANELAVADARNRADTIRSSLRMVILFRDEVLEEIEKARASEDHVTLGYKSWTAYVADEFGSLLSELDREDRRNVSAILSSSGMSVRAIATVTGVSTGTAHADVAAGVQSLNTSTERDLSQVSRSGTPGDDVPVEDPPETPWDGRERQEGSTSPSSVTAARPTVTGLDGKTYAAERPKRRKTKRPALNIELMQANHELQKAIRKMDRATSDPRFDRLNPLDREKIKNEFARHQKRMFELRARFGGER